MNNDYGRMIELNNNLEINIKRSLRNPSVISFSSASSCPSDDSCEDISISSLTQTTTTTKPITIASGTTPPLLSRRTSQDLKQHQKKIEEAHRPRSNSDGAISNSSHYQNSFEVFPSLPDKVLKRMGLLGDEPRVRPNEEELEQKFVSLSLAFTIDAATINDRSIRQKRYRDQTEKNLTVELEKLIQKANRIRCLCINAETTELLSALLEQIEIVRSAASHAIIAFERYGAVQHEQRISEAVGLIIEHVNMLKQQRDAARRHLQYTKKVLQNSNNGESSSKSSTSSSLPNTLPNGRFVTKRRASIATINQNQEKTSELRKISRRISDLSLRASSLSRGSRPSRLEFGSELLKIKEGMVDNGPQNRDESPNQSDCESNVAENSSLDQTKVAEINLNLREKLNRRIKIVFRKLEIHYNTLTDNSVMHEFFYFCAILCFLISILNLANILITLETAKRGTNPFSLF